MPETFSPTLAAIEAVDRLTFDPEHSVAIVAAAISRAYHIGHEVGEQGLPHPFGDTRPPSA